MNRENILCLADVLEANNLTYGGDPVFFDMRDVTRSCYDHDEHFCGTAACIAGWANIIFGEARSHVTTPARIWLGLTDVQADALFFENLDATREQAIAALRHLAETGDVEWNLPTLTPTEA